jgi:hypothetical protein
MTDPNDSAAPVPAPAPAPVEVEAEAPPARRSLKPLIAALAVALLGGGGWYLYSQGLLPGVAAPSAAKTPPVTTTALSANERLRVLAEVNGNAITAEEVAPALQNGLDRAVAVDRYVTRLLASEAALEEYPSEAKAARAAAEREVLANLYLRRKSEELVMAVTQADIDKFYKQQVRDEDYAIGFSIQESLRAGGNKAFTFGRNEPGVQHFHKTVDVIMRTPVGQMPQG